jgi:hypothetical protein
MFNIDLTNRKVARGDIENYEDKLMVFAEELLTIYQLRPDMDKDKILKAIEENTVDSFETILAKVAKHYELSETASYETILQAKQLKDQEEANK